MSHDHEYLPGEEPGQTDDPRSSSTMVIGVVGGVLLIVIVLWLQVIFNNGVAAERQVKQIEPRVESLDDFRARQSARLHSYGWVDSARTVVHIPIERAMELTVREMSGDRGGS